MAKLTDSEIKRLNHKAKRLRYDVVRMIGCGKPGHLGGSCSLAEIVSVLYFHKMKIDVDDPNWPDRDRFILSKGHAALTQYAALSELGFFPEKELDTLKEFGTILQGHPDMTKAPGIEANTGSLGQGLSMACGMALAARLDKRETRVFCILGDGEIAEGQIWEASMCASNYKLDNLAAILDKNQVQAMGPVCERYDTNPHPEKWLAFGWHVIEIDGHDVGAVNDALDEAETIKGKPTMIVAHTVKGKCVPFAEGQARFHHGIMTQEEYNACIGLFECECECSE